MAYKKYNPKLTRPAYRGGKYRFNDSIHWIKFADADEIIDQFLDRLEAAMKEYGPRAMFDLMKIFLKRAKKSKHSFGNENVRLAWKIFTSAKHAEVHACVNFDIPLKNGVRVGGKVFKRSGQIGRAIWRHQFDKKVGRCYE